MRLYKSIKEYIIKKSIQVSDGAFKDTEKKQI